MGVPQLGHLARRWVSFSIMRCDSSRARTTNHGAAHVQVVLTASSRYGA
jgi:hypothetical protein